MAKPELHAAALEMRKLGMSYSQIKEKIPVSRGTLSTWLRDYPLSEEKVRELSGSSEIRIERCRETKRRNREERQLKVEEQVQDEIGTIDANNSFLPGLFLYWGEGGKTVPTSLSISNTDPSVLRFFISWLESLGALREKIKVRVHLYSDMNIEEELDYWSRTLELSRAAFRKPYIKNSKREDVTYKQRFTHGTCNVIYYSRDLAEYVQAALKHVQLQFAGEQQV